MDDIETIRAFNRFYAAHIGLLDKSFLDNGLTLTEARVLFDLDAADAGTTARTLSTSLGLDEGYVSRLVAKFADKGWVHRIPDPKDARRRLLRLTEAGRARMAPLHAASRAAISAQIADLDRPKRADLLEAMTRIQALLVPDATKAPARLRALKPGDIGWILERHATLYASDEGFNASFEALVARVLAEFLQPGKPAADRGWIAEASSGRRLGCIFCVRRDAETAQLRLFLVDPAARGNGLGRRLLSACLRHARDQGFMRLVLWTHTSHRAACALYAASGFRMVEEKDVVSFGRALVEQSWEFDLRGSS